MPGADHEHDDLKAQIADARGKLRALEARLFMLGLNGDANVPEQIAELTAKVELLADDLAKAIEGGKVTPPAAIDWPRIPDDTYNAELDKLG